MHKRALVSLLLLVAMGAAVGVGEGQPRRARETGLSKEPTPAPVPSKEPASKSHTPSDSALARIAGRYVSSADQTGYVAIKVLTGSVAHVRSSRWESVGFFWADKYAGVLRELNKDMRPLGGPMGSLRFEVEAGIIRAHLSRGGSASDAEETWTPAVTITPVEPTPRPDGELPQFGEYVYVEELPEAITRVQPEYPGEAMRQGVEGTVHVQVLVGTDGLVKDVRIVKSIPALDVAAVAAVRQWKFKPALSKGQPVAVWVAVPVRFPR